MKIQPFNLVIALINLALLFFLFFLLSRAVPLLPGGAPVLRGSALELVDDHNQLRARIDIEADGEVMLRLLDQQGAIRVELGTSTAGSRLVLMNDAAGPGVQILANSAGSSLRLEDKIGHVKMITP